MTCKYRPPTIAIHTCAAAHNQPQPAIISEAFNPICCLHNLRKIQFEIPMIQSISSPHVDCGMIVVAKTCKPLLRLSYLKVLYQVRTCSVDPRVDVLLRSIIYRRLFLAPRGVVARRLDCCCCCVQKSEP